MIRRRSSSIASAIPASTLAIQIVPFGVAEKLLIARDVTQLEAVARMRRDFIANVSHELKTPLTVISGFVETLQELELDERQRARFLQLMREQAASMQRLVEDLLTLSALESEHNPLSDDRFAIVPLLLAVSADAKGLSKGNHEVSLDIADAATVVGQAEELASAFGNLVSNAIRYTPAAGDDQACMAHRPGRLRRVLGHRLGHRDRGRAHSAADGALLSGRPVAVARNRGDRPRACHRQARPASPSGRTSRSQARRARAARSPCACLRSGWSARAEVPPTADSDTTRAASH